MQNLQIILVRHGETIWNKEGRYQGRNDSSLTTKGEAETIENARKIEHYLGKKRDGIKLYSSPLGRAKQSSKIIAERLNLDLEKTLFDSRLVEIDYGIFEGKLKSICQTDYKKIYEEREANKWHYQIKQGESYAMAEKRVRSWISDQQGDDLIIVVAHEMINRILRGIYLNLTQDEILTLRQKNDTVLLLTEGEEHILY